MKKTKLLQEKLLLGNLDAKRDWGYAPEFVEGMWKMLQVDKPDDYVLATGDSHTVREFIETAFLEINVIIEWKGSGVDEVGYSKDSKEVLIEVDKRYFRPTEVNFLMGDSSKAYKELGWKTKTKFNDLVKEMVREDLKTVELEQETRRFGIDG